MRISDHTLNRLNILKAIFRHGPVARTDLPALTGLSAGLITQQTSALVGNGLVSETKDQGSRKGRPRQLLEIRADSAVVIGASIDGQGGLQATFVDLSGKPLDRATITYAHVGLLPDLAIQLGKALKTAIAEGSLDSRRIARIGIALPAVIDSAKGDVHFNATFPEGKTPFAGPIAEMLGIPVTIENEMDCRARAEHWFGQASTDEDFILVHIGHSLDSAEFAYGVPKHGANGLHPVFGHVKTATGPDRRPCFCGAKGCLSAYASMYGILEAAGQLAGLPFPPIDHISPRFDAFIAQARAGDTAALAQIEIAGSHLGFALANYLNTANPAKVFLSFEHQGFMDMVQPALHAALAENTVPGILALTRFAFFQATTDWRWAGTAALALEQMYLEDGRNERRNDRHARPSASVSARPASQAGAMAVARRADAADSM